MLRLTRRGLETESTFGSPRQPSTLPAVLRASCRHLGLREGRGREGQLPDLSPLTRSGKTAAAQPGIVAKATSHARLFFLWSRLSWRLTVPARPPVHRHFTAAPFCLALQHNGSADPSAPKSAVPARASTSLNQRRRHARNKPMDSPDTALLYRTAPECLETTQAPASWIKTGFQLGATLWYDAWLVCLSCGRRRPCVKSWI